MEKIADEASRFCDCDLARYEERKDLLASLSASLGETEEKPEEQPPHVVHIRLRRVPGSIPCHGDNLASPAYPERAQRIIIIFREYNERKEKLTYGNAKYVEREHQLRDGSNPD